MKLALILNCLKLYFQVNLKLYLLINLRFIVIFIKVFLFHLWWIYVFPSNIGIHIDFIFTKQSNIIIIAKSIKNNKIYWNWIIKKQLLLCLSYLLSIQLFSSIHLNRLIKRRKLQNQNILYHLSLLKVLFHLIKSSKFLSVFFSY